MDRGRGYRLYADSVTVHRPADSSVVRRRIPLDDPARPAFLALPHATLSNGASLRRAAFEAWADNTRERLGGGVVYATTARGRSAAETALALFGGALVAAIPIGLAAGWLTRPRGGVTIEPSPVESIGIGLLAAAMAWLLLRSLAAIRRAWLTRRGSFVHVDRRGIRTVKGQTIEPFTAVTAVSFDRWARLCRIDFADGRPPLHVPAERGALARLDLLLEALHPPLRQGYRAIRP